MLAIRMQRVGRKGHAQFRVVVQDSRQSPKSGKFVALLGSYNPHTKTNTLLKDKAQTYLNNGAQPSERVAKLFKSEGIKLPDWVAKPTKKQGKVKNPEKLSKEGAETTNKPADTEAGKPADAEPAEKPAEDSDSDKPTAAEETPKTDSEEAKE